MLKVSGNIQRCTECKKILEKWCLADYVSWLDICRKPTVNVSDVEGNENSESNETAEGRYVDHYSSDYSQLHELFPIKWKSGKYL